MRARGSKLGYAQHKHMPVVRRRHCRDPMDQLRVPEANSNHPSLAPYQQSCTSETTTRGGRYFSSATETSFIKTNATSLPPLVRDEDKAFESSLRVGFFTTPLSSRLYRLPDLLRRFQRHGSWKRDHGFMLVNLEGEDSTFDNEQLAGISWPQAVTRPFASPTMDYFKQWTISRVKMMHCTIVVDSSPGTQQSHANRAGGWL